MNTVKGLLSVIVPVYKVEKYLKRCLDSLAAQTYRNIEIILVDDGSPDRCPEICEERADADNRFRCIHQKNKGLSGARNTGIADARGEYIAFLDSDDWIEPGTYDTAISEALKHDADVLQWNAIDEYENGRSAKWTELKEGKADIKKDPSVFKNVAWNYILKRSLIDRCNLRFYEGIYTEDVPFTAMLFLNSNKIYSINRYFSHYFIREDSITNDPKKQLKRIEDSIFIAGEIEKAATSAGKMDEFSYILNFYVKASVKRDYLWKIYPPDLDKFRDTFPEAEPYIKWNSKGLRLLRFLIYSRYDRTAKLLIMLHRMLKKIKNV
ncbi:MAG: glycosyltransferase [Elusimicrobiales bacterium]|nr:glycosyltransferase [Elusimicrobiales bacterium]